jgi:hypothetical protein
MHEKCEASKGAGGQLGPVLLERKQMIKGLPDHTNIYRSLPLCTIVCVRRALPRSCVLGLQTIQIYYFYYYYIYISILYV